MTKKEKKVKDSNLEVTNGEAAALISSKPKKVKKVVSEDHVEKPKEKKKKKRSLEGEDAADTSIKPPKKVICQERLRFTIPSSTLSDALHSCKTSRCHDSASKLAS